MHGETMKINKYVISQQSFTEVSGRPISFVLDSEDGIDTMSLNVVKNLLFHAT